MAQKDDNQNGRGCVTGLAGFGTHLRCNRRAPCSPRQTVATHQMDLKANGWFQLKWPVSVMLSYGQLPWNQNAQSQQVLLC
jgi:hypothetical protein